MSMLTNAALSMGSFRDFSRRPPRAAIAPIPDDVFGTCLTQTMTEQPPNSCGNPDLCEPARGARHRGPQPESGLRGRACNYPRPSSYPEMNIAEFPSRYKPLERTPPRSQPNRTRRRSDPSFCKPRASLSLTLESSWRSFRSTRLHHNASRYVAKLSVSCLDPHPSGA
jgi:hypothetical protein